MTNMKEDLEFLKEMKIYYDKINENYNDASSFEILGCMIDDWIDELEQKILNKE